MSNKNIVILGVFVADTAYRASRQPQIGETLIGNEFSLGPGGKGSNQAVAAALAGGDVHFISRLGEDDFAKMAISLWKNSGITTHVTHHSAWLMHSMMVRLSVHSPVTVRILLSRSVSPL